MDEQTRNQIVKQLDELNAQVKQRLGSDPKQHAPVAAHVEELRTLVQDKPHDPGATKASAGGLERRLLAWEADHPQLSALASRVVRALEDAGL